MSAAKRRAAAGNALGKLGDLRPGVCTLEPELITIPVGEYIYGDGEKHTIKRSYAVSVSDCFANVRVRRVSQHKRNRKVAFSRSI
ncbi:MAG: hypothetical protein R6X34_08805 [Chloroflexota bacterium]